MVWSVAKTVIESRRLQLISKMIKVSRKCGEFETLSDPLDLQEFTRNVLCGPRCYRKSKASRVASFGTNSGKIYSTQSRGVSIACHARDKNPSPRKAPKIDASDVALLYLLWASYPASTTAPLSDATTSARNRHLPFCAPVDAHTLSSPSPLPPPPVPSGRHPRVYLHRRLSAAG